MDLLRITLAEATEIECGCVLMIPERAVTEPGYIKGLTPVHSGSDKHELQALAQTAYYRYQDDELAVTPICGDATISGCGETVTSTDGLLLYRLPDNTIEAIAHKGSNNRKLLEAANRYCTRWVRLDI